MSPLRQIIRSATSNSLITRMEWKSLVFTE